ncbi:hypothetical protein BRARA_B02448 [Brassica rapa]|uniref:Uncharacterized protein n=1 Tax=Brassica campestris TaxID=3711 RepID=A0A398AC27_BRACM|nr:hypothetical protein BRARA_B02448 [Brassica rapa]
MANPQLLLSEMKAIMVRDDVTGQHKHLLSRGPTICLSVFDGMATLHEKIGGLMC